MTPKSLFTIILKVLGIFFIKDILVAVPQLLSVLYTFTRDYTVMEGIWILLSTIATLLVYWYISYYLIFKTETLIKTFQLDKGFAEETFSLNIHRSSVLSIAIIVIGGLIVADAIPRFCRDVSQYFQQKRMSGFSSAPSVRYMIESSLKIVVGIVMISAQRSIVNFIESKRRKTSIATPPTE